MARLSLENRGRRSRGSGRVLRETRDFRMTHEVCQKNVTGGAQNFLIRFLCGGHYYFVRHLRKVTFLAIVADIKAFFLSRVFLCLNQLANLPVRLCGMKNRNLAKTAGVGTITSLLLSITPMENPLDVSTRTRIRQLALQNASGVPRSSNQQR